MGRNKRKEEILCKDGDSCPPLSSTSQLDSWSPGVTIRDLASQPWRCLAGIFLILDRYLFPSRFTVTARIYILIVYILIVDSNYKFSHGRSIGKNGPYDFPENNSCAHLSFLQPFMTIAIERFLPPSLSKKRL